MPIVAGPRRVWPIVAASLGNLVEWYDWYVYSACALYFAPVFFPSGDRASELLKSAAVFAIGFFMRPLGGWIMGIYADRRGRKAGLTLSVLLMCTGSLLIACTPGHRTIGIAAPILLVLARLLQGLSVGGEYGASATYLAETAERRARGLWSSLIPVTLIAGQLVALLVVVLLQLLLTRDALASWGWRIPFAIGGALAIAVFALRRRLVETHSFAGAEHEDPRASSATRLVRAHPRAGGRRPVRPRRARRSHRAGHGSSARHRLVLAGNEARPRHRGARDHVRRDRRGLCARAEGGERRAERPEPGRHRRGRFRDVSRHPTKLSVSA